MAKLYHDETGKWYGGDNGLNSSEYKINGKAFYNFCLNLSNYKPWTLESICAMLGNMTFESSVNPQRQEVGGSGYGLVQWTPKSNLINRAKKIGRGDTYNTMYTECLVFDYEIKNKKQWIKTSAYPLTFKEFTQSTEDLYYLTGAFLKNYERPADQSDANIKKRTEGTNGTWGTLKWYSYLSGQEPPEPEPPEPEPPEPISKVGWNYNRKSMIFLPPQRTII